MLIRRAEVEGRLIDVRVRGERVAVLGDLRPERGETVVEAGGGALLPGLHDHHLHLLSLAAAAASVRCGPPEVRDLDGLARALRAATGPVRGIGYHESVAGILDRHALDRLVPDRPVRVQHRGGALWMLNSQALAEAGLTERFPDGRLWRADELLRGSQPPPDLAEVGRRLAAVGITGVTDATPRLSEDTVRLLTGGALPQRLHLLGAPTGSQLPPGATVGPWKILRPDHEPPDWDALRDEIARTHAAGRAVAVHAVTRESLVVTLGVLNEVGSLPGDRIEHAAVVGEDAIPLLAESDPVVVTQPGFVTEREPEYRRDIPADEHADLYRYASLLDAGIRVAPSSDAPFADVDPWRTIAAAVSRELGRAERVSARRALDGYLAPLSDPGGPPRRITAGAPADLCLLRVPLSEALSDPDSGFVARTWCRGQPA
ncbi:amidohydrolase family protein [Amycolatopsis thermoflava]|uniref:amidohydrolase family protein n=1 Tax=Amycolatopsis thermoflava TaxID=84480 RepID=UPI0038220A49